MSTVAEQGVAAVRPQSPDVPVQAIHPWRPGVRPRLHELWLYRALFPYLAKELIVRRYRRTYLSWIWIPLRPAINIAAGGLVFGGFLSVSGGDRPYVIFFAFATAGWIMFERCLHWGTRAVRMASSFSGGAHFPRHLVVAASAGPAVVDFLLYAGVAILATLYFLITQGTNYLAPPQQMPVGLLGLVILTIFGLGVGMVTGPLAALTKEVRYAIAYVVQFWYFITPIIYPISGIPEKYRPIAELNPITAPVEMVKFGFLSTAPPGATSIVSCVIGLVVVIVGGLHLFSRFEQAAVDRL
jgi:lipopolysaccharide transport system permease protein